MNKIYYYVIQERKEYKKTCATILLCFITIYSIGQSSNQLNHFILESVCSYVKDYNAFAKQVNYDTIQ